MMMTDVTVEVEAEPDAGEPDEPDESSPDETEPDEAAVLAAHARAGETVVEAGISAGIAAGEANNHALDAAQDADHADSAATAAREYADATRAQIDRLESLIGTLAGSLERLEPPDPESGEGQQDSNPSVLEPFSGDTNLDIEPEQTHWLARKWFTGRKGQGG